jgi:hypothetical protein
MSGAGVAITIKNVLGKTTVPAFVSAATVSHGIQAATKGISASRRNPNGESYIML